MSTCKTCKWWDDKHPRLKAVPAVSGMDSPGFCRKHKPGAYHTKNEQGEYFAIGIQPVTDADERCAEHREKE